MVRQQIDEKIVRQIMLSGMNIARFNFSHQTHEEHKRRSEMLKKLRTELDHANRISS